MSQVKNILDDRPDVRQYLYAWGFLFSSASIKQEGYPFYDSWNFSKAASYNLLVHPKQKSHLYEQDGVCYVLIGHAYNPISGVYQEAELLQQLAENYSTGLSECWPFINELTGIFTLLIIDGESVHIIGDACCIQTTYYTEVDNNLYIGTHPHLLADILELQMDTYIRELISYKFFPLLGSCLPGDLSPYKGVKRLVPNHVTSWKQQKGFESQRFFIPSKVKLTADEIAERVSSLLAKSLAIIPLKWERPAISMTGGCDSKTTLSCACDVYDKYQYFSYISSEAEEVDAVAAKKICDTLGLEHRIYHISDSDGCYPDIEENRIILFRNIGELRKKNLNDVRKRCHFANIEDFDVEVKSWCSEIGRAYFSKRFNGLKDFGLFPHPRQCTTLYKFFLHNRRLVRQTDKIFKQYLDKFFVQSSQAPLPWQDQFFWEFRVAAWNGLAITGELRHAHDITIPYNNRIILQLLLGATDDEKIEDVVYTKIRNRMNPSVDISGQNVVNLKHTNRRAQVEGLYYRLHANFPF